MAAAQSPTVRRRRLALELRRLRETARLTCEEVAEQLECSASKVSRVETGRVSVSPRDVRDLLAIYNVPEEQREGLVQLARGSRQKDWWDHFGDTLLPLGATYLGLEAAASEIKVHRISRVPTLLQTADYTRTMTTAARPGDSPSQLDRLVDLQLERQRQAMTGPPTVWAVLDEAVIRRPVGGAEVMRAQLEHLCDLGAMPNIHLQVIPFGGGAHPGMDMPFVILEFPDPADRDVVCVTHKTGLLCIEDTAEVSQYHQCFHHLQAVALSFDDSLALITSVLKEL
jgi:transcriptional regulator with XRE-family HTH domain